MKIDINDLTFENLARWPVAIRYLVLGIIFLLILGLTYTFHYRQQIRSLDNAKQKEIELKQTLVIKQQLAANYSAYKEQLVQIKRSFGNMLRQLPSTTEVPGLLEDISQAGIASGLTFRLFKPQPEIKYEFYTELPIQIQVVGNYHQLAEFVSKIVNLDRIVTLHNFNIVKETPADKTGSSNLIMDITAKTYRYTESKDNP